MTRIALAPIAAALAALAAWPALAQTDAPVSTAPAQAYSYPKPVAAPAPAPVAAPAPAAPQTPPLTAEEMWPDAPPPPPPPPPLPPLPTSGDGVQVLSMLNNVCIPVIGGADINSVAPALGMKKTRTNDWVLQLTGPKKITVTPPGLANPTVCTITVLHDLGAQAMLEAAVDAWAKNHNPPLKPGKLREASQGFEYALTISTWSGDDATKYYALALNAQKKFDGSPVTRNADQAQILLSIPPK